MSTTGEDTIATAREHTKLVKYIIKNKEWLDNDDIRAIKKLASQCVRDYKYAVAHLGCQNYPNCDVGGCG